MEFDPSFQGQQHHPYLSRSIFPSKISFKPHTQTMFTSQSSFLIPSSPQHLMINVPNHNPTFVMEGPSSNPIYGGSSIGGFVNVHRHRHMMLAPNNNNNKMMDALLANQQHKGKAIWDFSQKTMVHPFVASPSNSPLSPYSHSSEPGLMMSEYTLNTDHIQPKKMKLVKEEINTNIAAHNVIKGQWTPEEDSTLTKLVNQFGDKKWVQIAKLMHSRIGKQCRERWNNHLKPGIKKDAWTIEEDLILIRGHQELGNKWSQIAKRLPGRPENTVKNHWNGTKRRRNTVTHNKNKHSPYEGSVLHAYIKRVTAAKEAAKLVKKSMNMKNKKVLSCGCDELPLLLGYAQCPHQYVVFNSGHNVGGGNIGYDSMPKVAMM